MSAAPVGRALPPDPCGCAFSPCPTARRTELQVRWRVALEERRFNERPLFRRKGGQRCPYGAGCRPSLQHGLGCFERDRLPRSGRAGMCEFDGDVPPHAAARSRSMARFRAMRVSHAAGDPSTASYVSARDHTRTKVSCSTSSVRRATENAYDEGVSKAAVPIVELCQCAFVAGRNAMEEAEIDLRTAEFHCKPTLA
jgi:hypothetical protein